MGGGGGGGGDDRYFRKQMKRLEGIKPSAFATRKLATGVPAVPGAYRAGLESDMLTKFGFDPAGVSPMPTPEEEEEEPPVVNAGLPSVSTSPHVNTAPGERIPAGAEFPAFIVGSLFGSKPYTQAGLAHEKARGGGSAGLPF